MKTSYKFIAFEEVYQPNRKTKTYFCMNKRSSTVLGVVKWYGHWRQYCYFSEPNIVYSADCLADIQHFIGQLKTERIKVRSHCG